MCPILWCVFGAHYLNSLYHRQSVTEPSFCCEEAEAQQHCGFLQLLKFGLFSLSVTVCQRMWKCSVWDEPHRLPPPLFLSLSQSVRRRGLLYRVTQGRPRQTQAAVEAHCPFWRSGTMSSGRWGDSCPGVDESRCDITLGGKHSTSKGGEIWGDKNFDIWSEWDRAKVCTVKGGSDLCWMCSHGCWRISHPGQIQKKCSPAG